MPVLSYRAATVREWIATGELYRTIYEHDILLLTRAAPFVPCRYDSCMAKCTDILWTYGT